MLSLKRRLYHFILRLHPATFRDRFAREMSLDFEDALAGYGFLRLLADVARSLIRQWTTAPAFSAPHQPAPISSHPLLEGHYMVLEGDVPTPLELLRGSVLFALMLFALSFALKHGGNYIHAGHNVGLADGRGNPSRSTAASRIDAHPSGSDYSQTLEVPTSSLPSQHGISSRSGHTIYINPAAPVILPQTDSWREFLARCALISAIVWITSLLVRRTKNATARIALVAAGLCLVIFCALIPVHSADRSVQAALLQPGNSRSRFESATIHLRENVSTAHSPTVAPGKDSAPAYLMRVNSSIRPLVAEVCNVPLSSIIGGPSWIDSDLYDITARVDPATFASMQKLSPELRSSQVRWMEQELLVDRFRLQVHVESREIAAPTGPGGHKASANAQPLQVLVIDHIERPSEN